MKINVFGLIAISFVLILCSCSDSSMDDNTSRSTMTATINGVEWVANTSFYNKLFSQIQGSENVNVSGTNTNLISIQLDFSGGLPTIGEYTGTSLYKEVRDGSFINWVDEKGVCKITSVSDDFVKGTFDLKLDDTSGGALAQKVIIGKFNVEVK